MCYRPQPKLLGLEKFDSEAIKAAVRLGRLRIVRVPSDSSYAAVIRVTRDAVELGESVSIFTHTNQSSAALSDAIRSEGILHEQVGFTEAFGEALSAQLAFLRYALEKELKVGGVRWQYL